MAVGGPACHLPRYSGFSPLGNRKQFLDAARRKSFSRRRLTLGADFGRRSAESYFRLVPRLVQNGAYDKGQILSHRRHVKLCLGWSNHLLSNIQEAVVEGKPSQWSLNPMFSRAMYTD